MVKKLIMDVGPGIDGTLALMAACCLPQVDLLGVGVVAGNLPLETVAATASGILAATGASAQVYKGASLPLYGKFHTHRAQGLGRWPVEADPLRISEEHVVGFLAQAARCYPEEVTLVTTGPLTNLALALEYHPEEMKRLARVVLMGGALKVPGNVTPAAEFNISADPDAAELVFSSGLNLTLVSLDVTRQIGLDSRDIEALSSCGRAGKAVAAMAGRYLEGCQQLPLHGPVALLAAVRPDYFELAEVAVQVETRGQHCRGQVLVDWDGKQAWPHKIKAALGVDARSCRELLLDLWTR